MTRTRLIGGLIAVVVLALIAWHWFGRSPLEADDSDHAESSASAAVRAAVVRVQRHNVGSTLSIAGEFKPFQDVDVHAKVAGYIRKIYVDVGDHVKAGQTLAVVGVPELQAQLGGADAALRAAQEQIPRAQGEVQRAHSAPTAAHATLRRLQRAAH